MDPDREISLINGHPIPGDVLGVAVEDFMRRGCNAVREHELNVQLQPATDRAETRAGAAAPERLGKFKITRVRACENQTADRVVRARRK